MRIKLLFNTNNYEPFINLLDRFIDPQDIGVDTPEILNLFEKTTSQKFYRGDYGNFVAIKRGFVFYETSCGNWVSISVTDGTLTLEMEGSSRLIYDDLSIIYAFFWEALRIFNTGHKVKYVEITTSRPKLPEVIRAIGENHGVPMNIMYNVPINKYKLNTPLYLINRGFKDTYLELYLEFIVS